MLAEIDLVAWVLIPLLVFLARMTDVALGTLRIIFLSRDARYLAPVLGFVEILIWLVAMRQIFQHLDNPACFVGFAAGFATGNFVGIWIEGRLAMGNQLLRVITNNPPDVLAARLRERGYGVTLIRGEGGRGPVNVLFTLLPRKDLRTVIPLVNEHHPRAFYSVEDVRAISEGVFPQGAAPGRPRSRWRFVRKGK